MLFVYHCERCGGATLVNYTPTWAIIAVGHTGACSCGRVGETINANENLTPSPPFVTANDVVHWCAGPGPWRPSRFG